MKKLRIKAVKKVDHKSPPGHFVKRPLDVAIEALKRDILRSERAVSFETSFDVCDSARSAYFMYFIEFSLNGAFAYRDKITKLMHDAHVQLQKGVDWAEAKKRKDLGLIRKFLNHNTDRINSLRTLHEDNNRIQATTSLEKGNPTQKVS